MPLCSVIIPVHNKASLTQRCLDVLLDRPSEETPFEIVVVDDASRDATADLLAGYGERIRVVTHATNTGFATACNDGAAAATGEWIVLLNNDTEPQPGWLDALLRYAAEHPAVSVVGAKMLFLDGTIQHAGMVICQDRFPRHIYTGFPSDHPAVNKSRRYQLVTGGCMLIRRRLFLEVGGFDTTYVNSFEDVDLCLRLGAMGHEIHYCHESVLYHLECASREGRTSEEDANEQIYLQRWGDRVQPDDLKFFFEDGLLGLEHKAIYPIDFDISPLLGVVRGEGRDYRAERLLQARTEQVAKLLKDKVRLTIQLREAEFKRGTNGSSRSTPPTIAPSGRPLDFSYARLEPGAGPGQETRPQQGAAPHSALRTPHSKERPFGVNLSGLFASEKGLGEGVRADIRYLEGAGIPYVLNNHTDPGSANQDRTFTRFSDDNPYAVNLVHVNVDIVPEFVQAKGPAYFQGRYNIGYWAWELSEFPDAWLPRLGYFDEIWVPSQFVQDAVARVSSIPVVRIPHALAENLPTLDVDRSYFGLPPDPFIFLFIFDLESHPERKNPLGLIEAFKKAFTWEDNALLVLKCSHSEPNQATFDAIRQAADGANVVIIDGVMTREEVNTLIKVSDCYVSLHRSEGFGLTLAEAMSLEKPVIATAYSGNMDFTTPANSFLVRYQMTQIMQEHGAYQKGFVWADPDVDHAAELMRYVFSNPQACRDYGRRARQDILRLFHPQVVGQMASARLHKFVGPRLATKLSPPPAGSANGRAPAAASQPAPPPAEPRVLFQGTIHRLPGATTDRLISVLIPVKNGAAKLRELLPRLLSQESPDPIEIVAVDSGSSDDSVELLREHGATVAAIDPRSFNHGLTRNLAAQLARGEIFVFMNQTTLPADEHWLANLVAPLHADPELAGVSARILPRPEADPLTHKDTVRDVSGSPDRAERQIRDWSAYAAMSPAELKVFVYFDTICAAIRAEVFRRLPFRPTDFGEDLIWGKEALEAGCKILYEPSAVALHSHNYSLLEIFRRNFDDGFALRKIIGWELDDGQVLPEIVGMVRDDWGYLAAECGLQGEELEHWRLIAAMRRTAQVLGHWMGVHRDPQTGSLTSRLSITEQIKAGAVTETADGWRT